MAQVKIYTTKICPYCVMAKRLLDQKKISFEEIDVSHDPELRSWLVEETGQSTVPQIFIHDNSIGGFQELSDLNSSGKLDELITSSS